MSQNLNTLVQNCLASSICKNTESITILENSNKYHDTESPTEKNDYTNKIFSLMHSLNEEGISNNNLGVINQGPSFREVLTKTVDALSLCLKKTPFSYVELGPEPIKTSFIISRLLQKGCNLHSYTSIDINPSSSSIMQEYLSSLISSEKIFSVNQDFNLCTSSIFRNKKIPSVFTMLGFQEGNDEPIKIAEILKRMTDKEDIIISEMQIMPSLDSSPIYNFYNGKKMKEFSKTAFRHKFGKLDSVYGFFLLPLEINSINCFVAITTETILTKGKYFSQVIVTNYCLKYHLQDFNKIREMNGTFKVLDSQVVEDESISFQISKRVR